MLVSHEADVSFGNVTVTPLPLNITNIGVSVGDGQDGGHDHVDDESSGNQHRGVWSDVRLRAWVGVGRVAASPTIPSRYPVCRPIPSTTTRSPRRIVKAILWRRET